MGGGVMVTTAREQDVNSLHPPASRDVEASLTHLALTGAEIQPHVTQAPQPNEGEQS